MRLALIFNRMRADTTGIYFERALRHLGVDVDHWWLRDVAKIPATYALYLRVDHGDDYDVSWPARLHPSVLYAIDTHLPHSWRKIQRAAGRYDLMVCAQRLAAERLRGAWVTFGCDPELHRPEEPASEQWDLVFVGSDGGVPRKFYLQALRERYPNSFIGPAAHTQLGAMYGRARIGFNYSIADDVNMRMFEVLGAGACLVTNALRHDDLARLGLLDRQHVVLYRSPQQLLDVVQELLSHREERRRIARAGFEAAWNRHTYTHRMEELLNIIDARLGIRISRTPAGRGDMNTLVG